jgi:hypothetical protein
MGAIAELGLLIIAYWQWVAVLIVGVIIFVAYAMNRALVNFWLMNAWYGVPLVGKLASLSRRVSPASDVEYRGWLQSEVTLGTDYKNHIHYLPQSAFNLFRTHLSRSEDASRRPMPLWLLGILIILVAAEGFGFSYLVAGGFAHDMSENARMVGTVAIVVVLCIVLVMMTHAAGHHLYRNLLIQQCEKRWDESGRKADLQPNPNIDIGNTHDDDGQPAYSQCVNRIGTQRTWWVVYTVAAVILIFAVVQVALRVNDSLMALTRDTVGVTTESDQPQVPNFDAAPMPDVIAKPQAQADHEADKELRHLRSDSGWLTSLALAFIYLITQATSIYAGYKYGFAGGKRSETAYEETRGAPIYTTYMKRVESWIEIAERRMAALHQRIRDNANNHNVEFGGSFITFLEKQGGRLDRLAKISEESPYRGSVRSHVKAVPTSASDDEGSVAESYEKLRSMNPSERSRFYGSLSEADYDALKHYAANLKARASQRDDLVAQERSREMDGFI